MRLWPNILGLVTKLSRENCEPVDVGEDGWSEWIHPVRTKDHDYLLQCCDCGLIHEMQFSLSEGIGKNSNNFIFRARRYEGKI